MSETAPKQGLLNLDQTKALYQEMLSLASRVIKVAKAKQALDVKEIDPTLQKITEQILLENNDLLIETYFSLKEDYLASHMVNSCIYSIKLAAALGYRDLSLKWLAQAAFLYDIGMIEVYDLANRPAKLIDSELIQVRRHTELGADLLKGVPDLGKEASLIVREHHEHFNASGYPQGLAGSSIHEFSRIAALCDMYEALTHERKYKKRLSQFESVKEVIKNKAIFDPKILKVFIDTFGVYPVGTLVQLNNQEVASVVKNNKESILRPVVSIVFDSGGQPPKGPKIIDLAKQTNLYIKKPLEDDSLNQK